MGDAGRKAELYEQFARVGKALASPKRLELLDLLAQGERSVEVLACEAGLRLTSPIATSPATSCETAGPDTPVRRARSLAASDSRPIARSARYWASVSRGRCAASSRSIQRDTSGATATRASAASSGL